MRWFRMYTEARNDAKLRSLTGDQHRVWFNLLCLAAEQDDRGTVSGYDDELLAVEVANGDVDLLVETLKKLEKLRIIEREGDVISFINWEKRQYDKPSDSAEQTRERKRKQREREKAAKQQEKGVTEQSVTPMSREVTPCHAIDTDTETDTEKYAAAPPISPSDTEDDPFVFYQNNFGPMSPFLIQDMTEWCEAMGDALVIEAMKRSLAQNKHKWSYVCGILSDWREKGIKTVAEAQAEQVEFQAAKERQNVVPFRDKSRSSPEKNNRVDLSESPKQTMYDPVPWLGMS